jgi:hypothetical protein
MFNILSKLRRDNTPDNPLSSLKTLSRWVNDLPAGNVMAAHEQVLNALLQFNSQSDQHTKERLDILMQLDLSARPLQLALCQQYLRNSRMSRVMESRLWHSIYKFYWEQARAYHGFIMAYVSHPAASRIKSATSLVTLRTLHAFGNVFKWHYFRYEKPEEKLWLRLHNLYRVAEFEGFSRGEINLYPDVTSVTCCAGQYTRALLLAQLDASALYPKQIEMADNWLNQWAHLTQYDAQHAADDHTFYVNLTEGVGARRVRNPDFSETCRFLNVSELTEKIKQSRLALQAGETAATLGLGEDCRIPDCFEMLDYAERQWGPLNQREQRKSVRTSIKKAVDVVHGFNEICALVKQGGNGVDVLHDASSEMKYDEMIDMQLYGFVTDSTRSRARQNLAQPTEKAPPHERWVMENESEHGFGASVPSDEHDWLRLGGMVALHTLKNQPWKLGVVRRLARATDGLSQVGIEILTHEPHLFMLKLQSTTSLHGYTVDGVDTTGALLPVPALFISQADGEHGEIILEAAQYASGRSFEVNLSSHKGVLRLRDVIEKGEGWMRVGVDRVLTPTVF